MKDFKSVWKQLASKNNVSNAETFQYCILRAMAAKHPDKEMLAAYFVLRAYTPIKNNNKLDNGAQPYQGLTNARYGTTKRSESPLIACLETKEEEELFWKLADHKFGLVAEERLSKKLYSFVFVRSDLSPEQKLVQSNHVNGALGWALAKAASEKPDEFPMAEALFQELHLVVCESKFPLEDIKQDITQHGFPVVVFREPDLGDIITAIASYPIAGNKKGFLRHHKPLRFPKPVVVRPTWE